MTGSLLYLAIAALAIYAIVRQFMEQQVTWRTLLLLPALSAYESYTEWQTAFRHFSLGLLLFERRGGNLPAVEMHQAFLFRDAAIGYWRAEYAIVVIQTSTIASDGKPWHVYAFYGLAGEEKGKLVGVAAGMGNVLKYLKDAGLDIPGWFP